MVYVSGGDGNAYIYSNNGSAFNYLQNITNPLGNRLYSIFMTDDQYFLIMGDSYGNTIIYSKSGSTYTQLQILSDATSYI